MPSFLDATPRRSARCSSQRLLPALLLIVATASLAHAQAGIQLTPDGRRSLINRDIGDERWAIAYDFDDRSLTGNVFFRDGRAPAFVWCKRVGDDGNPDPRAVAITYACSGAAGCALFGCSPDDWQVIDAAITLPGSFLQPPGPAPDAEQVPTTTEELFSYLTRGEYKRFARESAVHSSAGPHGGAVLSYVNALLEESLRSGGTAHPAGSASVKELYANDRVTLTGWAVSVKTSSQSDAGRGWYWREFFSTTDAAQSIGGQGSTACVGCHAAGNDYVRIPYPLQ